MSPILRLDYLGAGHPLWNARAAIAAIPLGVAVCVLDDADTFGRCLKFLRRVLRERPDVPAIFSHLHWDKDHKIIPLAKLKKVLPQYQALALEFPDRSIFVSHSLEYKEASASAVNARIDEIRRLAPKTQPINCLWSGATTPGVPTERHGGTSLVVAPGHIISTDGAAKGLGAPDCDMQRLIEQNQKALAIAVWAPRFNFRQSPPDDNTPPPPYLKRKAAPDRRYFEDCAQLLIQPGEPPIPEFAIPGGMQQFRNPELWKTFAEDEAAVDGSYKKDPRACLPLFICRKDASFVSMVARNGKLVGKLTKYGPYSKGGFRYYAGHKGGCGLSASQIASKARKLSGSPWIFLCCADDVWQPIHPIFRTPYFQG